MKRIIIIAAAGLLLLCALPHGAWAFGVKDVVAMSQDGVPDSLIIQKIRHSDTRFDLNAKDMHALREAGVSNDVISAMLRTENRDRYYAYHDDYFWPYYSPWYLDFDFGYYGPYYHGYAPLYIGRGYGFRGHERFGGGFRRR